MTTRKPARTSRPRTKPGTIPSTLWACGPAPIEVADGWPPRVLARALLEYSAPGDRVLLMPRTPEAEFLVGELDRVSAHTPGHDQIADTDLIVATTLPPRARGLRPWMVAEVASTRLKAGGLLVVLARSHRDRDGSFRDLTGDLVTEAQNTDLLYLQHLVAAPVDGAEVVATGARLDTTGDPENPGEHGESDSSGESGATPTDPVHIDVLVFLQPHDLTTAA
ncbi:hypothetical protein [Nocardia wallacei]|uniref:hypothetical protein n=1 Tax=Nocardia wallacei TaxID=480035 RepID=UPI002458DC7E|nr:hypothetical protein [Nocardia wallacei]